ncbi:MAG TPA: carboxypeptidase-like regulatory domain-containing protein [Nitrospirota bacterium]|nr:carboxypeptidase-like regulatory domain-containing protein [Nitrospirota bacterium]
MSRTHHIVVAALALTLGACSPKIYGTVQLFDAGMKPITPAQESPQGTVVNMINTTTTIEQASHAVSTDPEGKYESAKDAVKPGVYKVEASRIGYQTETVTVEVTRFGGKKAEFKLKKIPEGKRKSIEGTKTDEDKIVNPGEVNIQPPSM